MDTLERREYQTGEVIFRQGDASAELYHLLRGRVAISIAHGGSETVLAELAPGALFGEMALINGLPRTATATALEPVAANVIGETLFKRNTLGLPTWALSIARVLADRLKNTTQSLDRLLYQQAHTASPKVCAVGQSVSIVPEGLEIAYDADVDAHKLHLSGLLDANGLEALMNRINALRRSHLSPIVLNFANVVDVQRRALGALVELAKSSTDAVGRIQLENVQFIADKLALHDGFQEILTKDETPVRRIAYGETLVRQGDTGREMYVVKSGKFTVTRNARGRDITLWTAEEGDVLGEMSLISGQARSATITASRSSQVYVIDAEAFARNAYNLPRWFLGIIEGLVTRLRDTNQKLDEFVAGEFHARGVDTLLGLQIFEDVARAGSCRLSGSLSELNLLTLRAYVAKRLRSGVRNFHFDVTQVGTVDPTAVRYLFKLHKYLLEARGALSVKGSSRMQFPVDLEAVSRPERAQA